MNTLINKAALTGFFTSRLKAKVIVEIILILSLASISSVIAYSYVDLKLAQGETPFFYQISFGPAVMWACGQGFMYPAGFPELTQFLLQEKNHFNCSSIPLDLSLNPDFHARAWFYLLGIFGFIWRVTGDISWSHSIIVMNILYVIFSVGIYGIFRVALENKFFAAAISLVVISSSLPLSYLLSLRDFSKAPFMILAILFLLLILKNKYGKRSLALLGCGLGSVVGIGFGFRADILIISPIILFLLLFFLPRQSCWREVLVTRFILLVTTASTFLIFSSPAIFSNINTGSCLFHVTLLGLTRPFNPYLSLSSAIYELGHQYNDMLIAAMVNARGTVSPDVKNVIYCSPLYDQISGQIYFDYVTTFPGDMLTRGYASATSILSNLYFPLWSPSENIVIEAISSFYNKLMLGGTKFYFGFVTLAMVIFSIAMRSIRLSIAVFLLLVYLTFYPAIQAGERHSFHLQFIPLLLLAMQLYWAILKTWNLLLLKEESRVQMNLRPAFALVGVVVSLFLTSYLLILATKIFQESRLEQVVSDFKMARTSPLAYSLKPKIDTDEVFLEFTDSKTGNQAKIAPNILLIKFSESRTKLLNNSNQLPITLVYPSGKGNFDLTYVTHISEARQAPLELYMPAYYNPSLQDRNRPTGLLLSNSLIEELTGVYLVEGLRDYPLWLALQIAAEGDTNLTKSQQHLKVLGPHHKFLPALSDIM